MLVLDASIRFTGGRHRPRLEVASKYLRTQQSQQCVAKRVTSR